MRSNYGPDTDPSLLSELIALLILRGEQDNLTFTLDEQARLRRGFPDGFALVAFGTEEGSIGVRLMGREAAALVDLIHSELEAGSTDTLARLFRRPGTDDPAEGA